MKDNSISVSVSYINGTEQTVLDEEAPNQALEQYFFPNPGMPVTLSITARSKDGKEVSITIDKDEILIFTD